MRVFFLLALALVAASCSARPLDDERVFVIESDVIHLTDDESQNQWATAVNVPSDVDMVVTAWLWELVNAETGEPIPAEDLYVHHSAVHPFRGHAANLENDLTVTSIMSKAMHIIGATDYYNHVMEMPQPFGIFHFRDEPDWYMCCHIWPPRNSPQVFQRLTLWWHEHEEGVDRRVIIDKIGDARVEHKFGDVPYERRTFVGKLPPDLGLQVVGMTYHMHVGNVWGEVEDANTGDIIHHYEVPEDIESFHRVLFVPIMELEEPYRLLPGQWLYFNTLVDYAHTPDHERGPMQVALMINEYDDIHFYPYNFYHLNPDKRPCSPRDLGLVTRRCFWASTHVITSEDYGGPPANVLPLPLLQACEDKTPESCFLEESYPETRVHYVS